MRARLALCAAVGAAFLVANCGGHGTVSAPVPARSPGVHQVGANFIIKIPSKPKKHGVNPHYVSASTQSMSIAVNGGPPTIVNLTPSSPNCTPASGNTPLTCTATVPAPVGTDTFAVITYDQENGVGNLLSENTISATIIAGQANNESITLNGVIASLQLVLANPTPPEGTPTTIPLAVNAMDADSNIIIGPGSYDNGPIALSNSDTSGATSLSAASIGDPSVAITVAFNGNPIPGGSATFSASAGGGSIQTSGIQNAVLIPTKPLFVANVNGNTVTEYASPYTGAPTATISNRVGGPFGVAVDASGDLFVVNNAFSNVTEYAPPYTGGPVATISNSVSYPWSLAINAGGDLFIANLLNSTVTEYASPYTGAPTATISNSLSFPDGLAFDASGDLFVANAGNHNVTEYAPPYTGAPTATISNGVGGPFGLAVDASGDLFIANNASNNVTEYAPPYTGAPIATITNSVSAPRDLAFDANGDLFVANYGSNTVTEYASPFTGAPIASMSNSMSGPTGLAFGP